MTMKKLKAMTLSTLCVLAGIAGTFAQQVDIPWFTIDGGGGTMRTADDMLELRGTIAQPDAGTLSSSSFSLVGGFRVRFATPDADGDGDVDLEDYVKFSDCVTGPDESVPGTCTSQDQDGDVDVDLQDFARFQKSFTGQP